MVDRGFLVSSLRLISTNKFFKKPEGNSGFSFNPLLPKDDLSRTECPALIKLLKKSGKFESKEDLIHKLERLSQLCEQQLNAGSYDLAETYENFQNTLKARISPF